MTTDLTGVLRTTETLDHRTGDTLVGGPASRYRRVVRCDGRSGGFAWPVSEHSVGVRRRTDPSAARTSRSIGRRPNYAARRLAALLVVTCGIVAGGWLVGQVATGFAGRPASAAAPGSAEVLDGAGVDTARDATVRSDVHVARPGDTLWSIADAHRGDVARERYVDALVMINGGTVVDVGQAIHLPPAPR